MRAEKMMKEYKQMKLELEVTEMQLQRFTGISEEDMISTMSFSHPEGDDRVQTSGTSDKTAKIAINYKKVMERENEEWYRFLLGRYRKLKMELDFFEDSVRRLSGNLPEIVMDLLDTDITWDEIAGRHHVNRSMIGKYRKAAIKELDAIYEVRELCASEFMLS